MIENFRHILKQFKNRGGYYIFVSTIISQITQMILIMFVVRILEPSAYGELTFIQSYIIFFIPFSGMGLNYSLLRYGSVEERDEKKNSIFRFCLKYGMLFSIILYIIIVFVFYLFQFEIITNFKFVMVFGIFVFTNYLKEIAQSYLRIQKKNKEFAYSNITYSIMLSIITIISTYYIGMIGYILARVTVPAIVFILIRKNEKISASVQISSKFKLKEYSSYGIFVGLGSVASQLMYQVDNLLLGFMGISASIIAEYKVATVIPFAVLFIPSVFMTTDFVMIAEKYEDKKFLINYRNKMMKLLLAISIFGTLVSLLFSKQILTLLYSDSYENSYKIMNVLMIGIIASFALRAPNGNILAAVGKSKWNAILAYSTVGLNLILNYMLIKNYGHYGAALATTIVMWITGIISYLLFNKYVNELK